MAKQTNRVAWGLTVVLAAVMLAGIIVLCSRYVVLLPRQEWGFGWQTLLPVKGSLVTVKGSLSSRRASNSASWRLGDPYLPRPRGSTRRGTGR
jgi:hypothetical protein